VALPNTEDGFSKSHWTTRKISAIVIDGVPALVLLLVLVLVLVLMLEWPNI
jgi:hypothetical protein